MSVSPERRFEVSPKNEMLKFALSTSHKKTQLTLLEHRERVSSQRAMMMDESLEDVYQELNKTRERVDSISRKLDFLIDYISKDTMFKMDDI